MQISATASFTRNPTLVNKESLFWNNVASFVGVEKVSGTGRKIIVTIVCDSSEVALLTGRVYNFAKDCNLETMAGA